VQIKRPKSDRFSIRPRALVPQPSTKQSTWPVCYKPRRTGLGTFEEDDEIVSRETCKLGCERDLVETLSSMDRRARSPHWVKIKNPNAPAVKRKAEQDSGK
jgi:hypothetical protein